MNFFLAKKKMIIIISAILALISLVTGLTTLSISSQKQLNRLEQFPTQLDNVITDSLQGKDSVYYKVFLISLDPGSIMEADGTNKLEFTTLLMDTLTYHSDGTIPQWTQDELDAMAIGQGIWQGILDTLKNNHLTYGATSGLGYFIQNLAHGMTVKTLLNSPIKQTQVIDTVLKGLLTEMDLPLAYKQVNEVNAVAAGQHETDPTFPVTPPTIDLNTPYITGIKAGTVISIIIAPILIIFSIIISFSYYLYARKHFFINNWNKLLVKFKKTEKQAIFKPEVEETN